MSTSFGLVDLKLETKNLKVLILVSLMVIIATISTPVTNAHPSDLLPVGSYWTLTNQVHQELTGTGSFNGTWSRDEKYDVTFSILTHDSHTITVRVREAQDDTWSSNATDSWVKLNGGATNHGTVNPLINDYTIDTTTLMVIGVSNKNFTNSVGEYSYVIINPQGLSVGSQVPISMGFDRVDPSQSVSIEGVNVDSWMLTWTGSHERGYWHDGNTYSRGPEMWTEYYDKTYGLRLAHATHGIYRFNGHGGGWRETKNWTSQAAETNITFSRSSSSPTLFQPYVLGGIAAVVAIIIVAFLTTRRRKASSASSQRYDNHLDEAERCQVEGFRLEADLKLFESWSYWRTALKGRPCLVLPLS